MTQMDIHIGMIYNTPVSVEIQKFEVNVTALDKLRAI